MSFPVPVAYDLNAQKDTTIIKYNNGDHWEGLPGITDNGGNKIKIASGYYIPDNDYNTDSTHLICSINDIGFIPSLFIFELNDMVNVEKTKYLLVTAVMQLIGEPKTPMKTKVTFFTGGGVTSGSVAVSWGTSVADYLELRNNNIYFRTSERAILKKDIVYKWIAYE